MCTARVARCGFPKEHVLGITPAWPGRPGVEALLGVKAILLITRNCQYFPCFSLRFSFVFQLYEKYGVTMSGVLKRKYEELGDDSTYCSSSSCSPLSSSASSGWETDEESSRGEPKPSSAITPSFTREYLHQPLSWDQTFLCVFFCSRMMGYHHAETSLEHTFRSGSSQLHVITSVYLGFVIMGQHPQGSLP